MTPAPALGASHQTGWTGLVLDLIADRVAEPRRSTTEGRQTPGNAYSRADDDDHKEVAPETDMAIRRLLARYCHLVDDRDLDATRPCSPRMPASGSGTETMEGQDAIRSWLDSVPAGCATR